MRAQTIPLPNKLCYAVKDESDFASPTLQEFKAFFVTRAVSVSEFANFLQRHFRFFSPDQLGGRQFILPSFLDNHDGDRYLVT